MKGKRLLIVGAALALALTGCANETKLVRTNPLRADNPTIVDEMAVGSFDNAPSNYTTDGTEYSKTGPSSSVVYQATGITSAGNIRGNKTANSGNFNLRNSTTKSGYYVSKVKITESGGTMDPVTANRSVLIVGSSVFAKITNATVPSGTQITANETTAGTTLTFENSDTSVSYFQFYSLKTSGTCTSASIEVTWSVVNSSIPSHSLTYAEGLHGSYDGETNNSFTVVEQGNHVVLSPSAVGISADVGYVFNGWSDGANTYDENDDYTMGSSDVTLTAQWVAGVGLLYNANGGSNAPDTSYVASGEKQIVAPGKNMTAPVGKEFAHWNTKNDDTGISYNPGDEILNFTTQLTLYAIWEDATYVEFDATVDKGTSPLTKSDVKLTLSDGVLNNGENYRIYKNQTLKIERTSGKISSIQFTCTANGAAQYGPGCFVADKGNYAYSNEIGTWEGAESSVTFTASTNQVRATLIRVNYLIGSDVNLETEVLELTVGGTSSSVGVANISGVKNPTFEWAKTTGDDCVILSNTDSDAVTVAPKGTKFASCKLSLSVDGSNLDSPIVREVTVFVARESSFANPYDVTEARHAIDLGNADYTAEAFAQGIVSQIVTPFNSQYGNISYNISADGSTSGDQLEAYRGKGLNNEAFTSEKDVEVGASVVVFGSLTKHNQTYEFAEGNYLKTYSALNAKDKVAKLGTRSAFSYSYNVVNNNANDKTDTLDNAATGVSGTSYSDWTYTEAASGVSYAGTSAGGNSSIQLKVNDNKPGIVATANTNNLVAKSLTISWNESTAEGRTVSVYGKNTGYSGSSDLSNSNDRGTLITTLSCDSEHNDSTVTIGGSYEYIGITPSGSGAMYLDSVKITWGSPNTFTYPKVSINFGGFISQELWEELDGENHDIKGYGVIAAYTSQLGGQTLKAKYENALNSSSDVMTALANTCAGSNNKIKYFDTTLANAGDTPAEANVCQKTEENVGVSDTYYVWSVRRGISDATTPFSAIAYIRLENEIVFFKETSKTAKQAAGDLLALYSDSDFDGSLRYYYDHN